MGKSAKINKISLAKWLGVSCGVLFLPIEIKVGLVLRPFDFMLAIALLMALFIIRKRYLVQGFFSDPLTVLYVSLSLYISFNGLFLNPSSFAKEFIQRIEYIIFLYLVFSVCADSKSRKVFFKYLYYSIGALLTYAVLWHITHGYIIRYKTLHEPKYLFGFFSLWLFIKSFFDKKFLSIFLFSFIFLVFSLERKGWVAFSCGAFFISYILFFRFHYQKKIIGIYSGLLLICLLLVAVIISGSLAGSDQLVDQMGDTAMAFTELSLEDRDEEDVGSKSNAARMYLIFFSLQSIKKHPVVGIGTDGFKKANEAIAFKLGQTKAHGAHNDYLRIAVENGLPAVFVYIVVWFLGIRRALKYSYRKYYKYRFQQEDICIMLGMVVYGAIINIFAGGGAINIFFFTLPAGVIAGYCLSIKRQN